MQIMKPLLPDNNDEDEDDIGDDDLPTPPTDISYEVVDAWLVTEAREAYNEMVMAASGAPYIPSPDVQAAGRPSDFTWPPPIKRWRVVKVEEHKIDGVWCVDNVDCECGRQRGTGRHCAHAFRALDVVQCHAYKVEWLDPYWVHALGATDGAIQPVIPPSRPLTTSPAGNAGGAHRQPATTSPSDDNVSTIRELHNRTAKAYGHSLCDMVYRYVSRKTGSRVGRLRHILLLLFLLDHHEACHIFPLLLFSLLHHHEACHFFLILTLVLLFLLDHHEACHLFLLLPLWWYECDGQRHHRTP